MKRRYSFVGDDNKPYGEFIVIGSEREGFYWHNDSYSCYAFSYVIKL